MLLRQDLSSSQRISNFVLSVFVSVFVILCLIVLLRTTLVAPPETGPKLSYIQGILIILGEPYALSFWSILESADKLKH